LESELKDENITEVWIQFAPKIITCIPMIDWLIGV
jgi:hypothetical protein